MPQRLFVTIGSRRRKDRVLLELPGDKPIQELIPDLIQVLGWKEFADIPPQAFYLETEEGEKIPGEKAFLDAGVTSSDLLYLSHKEPEAPPVKGPAGAGNKSAADNPPGESGKAPAVSPQVQEILRQPRLEGPRGLVFLLGKPPVLIGRSGKGNTPDIDLLEWDADMIVSRRHAVIELAKDGLGLKPEKTTNGTFLNGVEVPAGESRILRDGDRIHFGFKGLELVFKAAEK
jgi:hypothetical protein